MDIESAPCKVAIFLLGADRECKDCPYTKNCIYDTLDDVTEQIIENWIKMMENK